MKSNWRNQGLKKSKNWRNQRLKKSENRRSRRLKFGDSTRFCDSSRVSRATDVGMPFKYPWISIPDPIHYGSGQV
jgi:hypothetical protein